MEQAPDDAGSEFSVEIESEEGAKPVVAAEGDFVLLVTDGSEDAFEMDIEAYDEVLLCCLPLPVAGKNAASGNKEAQAC